MARSASDGLWGLGSIRAVWHDLATGLQAPRDVGDTRKEVLAFIEPVITTMRSPLMSSVIRGLASEIAAGGDLSRSYREIVEARLLQLRDVVSRGIERGDLRPDTDVRLAHELLLGPVMYRLLFSGQPLDDGLGARVGDAVLRAFAAE